MAQLMGHDTARPVQNNWRVQVDLIWFIVKFLLEPSQWNTAYMVVYLCQAKHKISLDLVEDVWHENRELAEDFLTEAAFF